MTVEQQTRDTVEVHATDSYPEQDAVRAYFADRAEDLDRGAADIRHGLRRLGEWNLLSLGAPANRDGALWTMVRIVEDVAAGCLSSGFSLWAHRMVVEYLARSRDTTAITTKLDALREGSVIGSTAMASALRDVAGIEPVPVLARRITGGLVLDGKIRWASNLFEGALVVLPVRFEDGGRAVVQLWTTDDGVRVAESPELLALNSTASSSITLEGAEISDDAVLVEDLAGFVAAIRPTFLLLQTAFCIGLAGTSLIQALSRLAGPNTCLAGDVEQLRGRHESLRHTLSRLAQQPEQATVPELLRLRLDAASVAISATRLEATASGGPGYLAASATSRRLREAAFLPIQAPTEGQLRWELAQYD